MYMLSTEVITETVNAPWKVKSQTAEVSCQEKYRNDSATCCLNRRSALSSFAQISGQTLEVDFSAHVEIAIPCL